ncbi:MAG: hypothetical protein ACM3PP_04235 [Candidatus Saccharibacteria bacterium]
MFTLPNKVKILIALGSFIVCYRIFHADPTELTLLEAIKAAAPIAGKWSSQARPVYIVSTDAGEDSQLTSGANGARANWNAVFVDPKSGHNLLVAIRRGQPRYTRQLLMAFKSPINVGDLKYDSPAALHAARKVGRLIPGMTNYHFELRFEHHPVMRIYYRSSSGSYRFLDLDEETCRFLP